MNSVSVGRLDEPPHEVVPREVTQTLYAVQEAILRHPMVMQAAFSALVAEGRRFAKTPEGATAHERLGRGASTERARLIWEMLSTNAFVEQTPHALPSVFIERLVRALAVKPLEPLLASLFQSRGREPNR